MNSLFVAWRPESAHAGWRPIGRLEHDDGLYRFFYLSGARKPGFRPLEQMDDLERIYESEKLFPVFANRLLSKNRPEYDDFLRWGGFDVTNPPDPIVVLGVSEGRRQTDAIEVFPCPQPDGEGCYVNKFFLHGIRGMSDAAIHRINELEINQPLRLMLDVQNKQDHRAVAIRTDDNRQMIGYFPRYLAQDAWSLLGECDPDLIDLFVDQVNRDAPLQNRVLCRMHACWPDGFVPCSGDDFVPIPADISTTCLD